MGTFRFKSDLRNHQAIVQPRLYDAVVPYLCDCLMITQITLTTGKRHRRGRTLADPEPTVNPDFRNLGLCHSRRLRTAEVDASGAAGRPVAHVSGFNKLPSSLGMDSDSPLAGDST